MGTDLFKRKNGDVKEKWGRIYLNGRSAPCRRIKANRIELKGSSSNILYPTDASSSQPKIYSNLAPLFFCIQIYRKPRKLKTKATMTMKPTM